MTATYKKVVSAEDIRKLVVADKPFKGMYYFPYIETEIRKEPIPFKIFWDNGRVCAEIIATTSEGVPTTVRVNDTQHTQFIEKFTRLTAIDDVRGIRSYTGSGRSRELSDLFTPTPVNNPRRT